MLIILVGNKSDLDEQRQVPTEEGAAFARRNDLIFFETSAKTSAGVEQTFVKATKEIYHGILANKYDLEGEAIGIKAGNTALPASARYANLETGEKKTAVGNDDKCCK